MNKIKVATILVAFITSGQITAVTTRIVNRTNYAIKLSALDKNGQFIVNQKLIPAKQSETLQGGIPYSLNVAQYRVEANYGNGNFTPVEFYAMVGLPSTAYSIPHMPKSPFESLPSIMNQEIIIDTAEKGKVWLFFARTTK